MVSQELSRKDGIIEIKLTHGAVTGFLGKFFSKNPIRTTTVSIDKEHQKITIDYSDGDNNYEINFSAIEKLIIHQYKSIEDEEQNFLVALILNEEPKYLALYSFVKPTFGKELFQEIELILLGKNDVSKIYTFEAAKHEFNL